MSTTTFLDVDVRPTLRAGGEPFGEIMAALSALRPDQGLRLIATFKPEPLFSLMESRGFSHEAKELERGEWEVLFRPLEVGPGEIAHEESTDPDVWPPAARHLDNRDLDPPEPMVRILVAIESMAAGEVLSAWLCRKPVFLFPELAKRGHAWRGADDPDGAIYRILIRVGASQRAIA
ncbi:MAG TPA: DUF2249 domain-containing protein [Tardiphaga sp.]